MKTYGLVIEHDENAECVWTKDFVLFREDRPAEDQIKLPLDTAPSAYSGRDFFTFESSQTLLRVWLDVYRTTAAEKIAPPQYFQREHARCFAHVLAALGQEPILILIGRHGSFNDVKVEKILDVQAFRDLMVSYYPKITLTRDGDAFTAKTSCPADLYWETTGGILSTTRTASGQSTTLSGADPGVRVRVGWKYFSNVAEIVV